MESQSLRIRLVFEDRLLLNEEQRLEGMSRSWLLVQPHRHRKISDVCNHLLHIFNLRHSCPNGILLYMEGFVLPPSESTQILKDKEIICVKRKGMALTEAIEAADTCNLLEAADTCNLLEAAEINRNEPVDNGMLLLANEEFDKEIGGYQSESEGPEEEKLEADSSPVETVSKKRKASTKLRSSKNKKHRSVVVDGIEDEVAAEDNTINNDECLPMNVISKKSKPNKEKGSAETIIVDVKSPPKVKRKKKHLMGVANCAENDAVTGEIENVNNGESPPREMSRKKKSKRNEDTNKGNAETNDEDVKSLPNVKRGEHFQDNVGGVEQASTAPDEAKKVPSRSARRKKAKRQLRRELAKLSQMPDNHPEPEVSKSEKKEANGHPKGFLKQDQLPTKLVHKNMIQQEEKNHNGNVDTELVPCIVRPGHIRFEPLEEDEDAKQTEVTDVPFQWNGITSKKKGQKWGLDKFSTFQRDNSQKASIEPSKMSSEDTESPVIDLNDFDKLPLCTLPKEGDVIAYRILELSSTWTPEISPFRVGKISHYDGTDVKLVPVPEYPIFPDKMDEDEDEDEDGPVKLYEEDGSLKVKFAGLLDVRFVKQNNKDAVKGVDQTPQGDDKDATSNLLSSSKDNKANLSTDPTPVEANAWDELKEALNAKKSQLLEEEEGEVKRDSGWNRWSYRALRGSALGPTMALLRSNNNI